MFNFKYDTEKDHINQDKFGISFRTAAHVFLDKNYLEMYDIDCETREDRYIALGIIGDTLFVVTTIKGNGDPEIVAARLATEKERKLYYGRILYN